MISFRVIVSHLYLARSQNPIENATFAKNEFWIGSRLLALICLHRRMHQPCYFEKVRLRARFFFLRWFWINWNNCDLCLQIVTLLTKLLAWIENVFVSISAHSNENKLIILSFIARIPIQIFITFHLKLNSTFWANHWSKLSTFPNHSKYEIYQFVIRLAFWFSKTEKNLQNSFWMNVSHSYWTNGCTSQCPNR